MNIKQYIDSTYLKTAEQAGISETENADFVENFVAEAIAANFKLVMVRPNMVAAARRLIANAQSKVAIGTVIDFPEGTATSHEKMAEAQQAIANGVDELDFVCNYNAFKNGQTDLVKSEIRECTKLALDNHKTVKWIIEVAALNSQQIVKLTTLIKNVVISNFDEDYYHKVFVKSSTGFYKMPEGLPNGATVESIIMMIENAFPLPVKASGGIKSFEDAIQMIRLGVKRIGTSSAMAICSGMDSDGDY